MLQVMADMTVSQCDTGEVTSGLVTNTWSTRRVMKLHTGDKEVITRIVRNRGEVFTVENIFGEQEKQKQPSVKESGKQEKRGKRKPKPLKKEETKVENEEDTNPNIIKIPASNLDNFLSEPAAILMERMFAKKKVVVAMSDLKTLNDTGDIVKISYNSSLKDDCLEIVKTLNCGDCDDIVIKNVVMDLSGHIITCKYEDATWIRDNQMVDFKYF